VDFWLPPLLRLAAVGLAGLLGAALGGAAIGWAITSIGFFALVLVQLRYLSHLRRWITAPTVAEIPEGWGAWGDVFAEMYRVHRRDEKSRAELARALDRFVKAAQALPDGVILVDLAHHIRWANATAERQFEFSLKRDRGQLMTHLIRYPEFGAYLARTEQPEPLALHIAGPPARDFSIQVIQFAEDEVLVISRDVTALARTDAIRRDFIANVSHELRTPLTVVSGYLEHMHAGTLADPRLARPVALMQEQASRMTHLIEDLLTLSRLEADDVLAREDDVDIGSIVDALVDEGRSLSKGRHVIDADVAPGTLRGATDELRSAFSNLVSNAIRYTPEGGRITLRWQPSDAGARFSVVDSGIGIAPEHLPRLTERFYRVDRSRSRETGGTGLGLAIVKHVLSRHQATLAVDSTPGQGSAFHCDFPASRVLAASRSQSAQEDPLKRAAH
jgi:two-component system, OmpR family, phosphate regulon sensor histidine kinase PhoR